MKTNHCLTLLSSCLPLKLLTSDLLIDFSVRSPRLLSVRKKIIISQRLSFPWMHLSTSFPGVTIHRRLTTAASAAPQPLMSVCTMRWIFALCLAFTTRTCACLVYSRTPVSSSKTSPVSWWVDEDDELPFHRTPKLTLIHVSEHLSLNVSYPHVTLCWEPGIWTTRTKLFELLSWGWNHGYNPGRYLATRGKNDNFTCRGTNDRRMVWTWHHDSLAAFFMFVSRTTRYSARCCQRGVVFVTRTGAGARWVRCKFWRLPMIVTCPLANANQSEVQKKHFLILQWKLLDNGEIWRRKTEDFVSRECVRVRVCTRGAYVLCEWVTHATGLSSRIRLTHLLFFFCFLERKLVPVSGSLSLIAPLQKLRCLLARSKLSEIIKEMKHL